MLVVYRRTDTFAVSPEHEAGLRKDAQLHPQSRARVDLQRLETARSRGGLVVEHRLWLGDAGFRHNQDLLYEPAGAFIDCASGKESGWSLSPHALNRMPAVASQQPRGRGAEQFRAGFLQDLLPSLTGGLSEVIKREFGPPSVTVTAAGFVVRAEARDDRFLSGMRAEGAWDAGADSGRVSSLTLVSRQGPGSDETLRFWGWTTGGGLEFAQRAARSMPSIHTTITVEIGGVERVPESEVVRVISEPKNPGGGQAHVDAVRGELSLGSRTLYGAGTPVAQRLTAGGAVPVDVHDPTRPDAPLRVLGWVLGGGIVSGVIAFYCWKRQRGQ